MVVVLFLACRFVSCVVLSQVETLHLHHGSVFQISFCNVMLLFMALLNVCLHFLYLNFKHEELNPQKGQQHWSLLGLFLCVGSQQTLYIHSVYGTCMDHIFLTIHYCTTHNAWAMLPPARDRNTCSAIMRILIGEEKGNSTSVVKYLHCCSAEHSAHVGADDRKHSEEGFSLYQLSLLSHFSVDLPVCPLYFFPFPLLCVFLSLLFHSVPSSFYLVHHSACHAAVLTSDG